MYIPGPVKPLRYACLLVLLSATVMAGQEGNQDPPATFEWNAAVAWYSGLTEVTGEDPEIVAEHTIEIPGSYWMQLSFDQIDLPIDESNPGLRSTVTVTTCLGGESVEYDAIELQNARNRSLLFNGDRVEIVVRGIPGYLTGIGIEGAVVQKPTVLRSGPSLRSLCGGEDDRELSNYPWVGRLVAADVFVLECSNDFRFPYGYQLTQTVFLAEGRPHGVFTASHCTRHVFGTICPDVELVVDLAVDSWGIVGFNWPPRGFDVDNNQYYPVFPALVDQYHYDVESLYRSDEQRDACANVVGGQDTAFIGVFPNPATGMDPLESQGQGLIMTPPPAVGAAVEVIGYGGSEDPAMHIQQQVGIGTLGWYQCDNLGYDADTTGGTSGGPVVLVGTREVIGIHSAGGCHSTDGQCPVGSFTCVGDLDLNNAVDIEDILMLLNQWGTQVDSRQDFDCDGIMGPGDLNWLIDYFGDCPQRDLNGGQSIMTEELQLALQSPMGIAAVDNCLRSDAGDCLEVNGTPACCDCDCAELVCLDSDYRYCCVEGWDQACVDRALQLCCSFKD